MENARTISSAAAPAAPPSAICPMVTPRRPAPGRGTGRKRESLGSRKPDDSQTQGPLAKSRRMEPDRPELSLAWAWGHKGVAEPHLAVLHT